jgi:PBP1b-binding outer membrane lipoprotein LpoB
MKTLIMLLLTAATLAGCVVEPARPVYVRPAVVVY